MITLQRQNFEALFAVLKERGYATVGPTLRDEAIVCDEISSSSDLPEGWTEIQEASTYRLRKRNDKALFGYVLGPQSWKKFLFPPRHKLMTAEKRGKSFEIRSEPAAESTPHYAFIGARPCELKALLIQDRVFINEQFTDATYLKRRKKIFIVAVNCTAPGGTCFCSSMNTGPKATDSYDIVLTEVLDDVSHYFVAESGTDAGAEVLRTLSDRQSTDDEIQKANRLVDHAADKMGRVLDTNDLAALLMNNLDNPHWDSIERRCLLCANCTMVCPTCFCSTVEEVTDLSGGIAERWRRWDSCFTLDYAKVTGGNFRFSPKARYRQWMTHKLATWKEQFDTLGCVGCGRCITWCPVGIDITAEALAIRSNSLHHEAHQSKENDNESA